MTPMNPPPNTCPRLVCGVHNIYAGTLRPFVGSCVYCWMKNRRQYWFYPLEIGTYNMVGYVWRWGRWRLAKLRINRVLELFKP